MTVPQKLAALRAKMAAAGIDAYIIPSGDPHNSEYMADHWLARQWLSGFTGSSGLVVVLQGQAGLWTDGRYFIQAERELAGSGISLFKDGEPGVLGYQDFLKENIPAGGKIGFDGRVLPLAAFTQLKAKLPGASYAYSQDIVGSLWDNRPPMPSAPAFYHEEKFAGSRDKLQIVRDEMQKKGINYYLVAALDDIAWLANIRGCDISESPVAYSYALVTETDAHLFIEPHKAAEIQPRLPAFQFHGYSDIVAMLKSLPPGGKILLNSGRTNMLLAEAISSGVEITTDPDEDILPLLKAVKSPEEIANTRNAYIREGVVLVKMLKWLEESLATGETLHEGDVSAFITAQRQQQENSLGDSFETIAAYGANAAQMHYHPQGRGAEIKREGFLLIDTGGQYLDGTTDTTRTIPVGNLTPQMKRDFTLVLRGMIRLSMAKFLQGTTGHALDMLARQPILATFQNYRSGTGHGIGYCLNVHEGPQSVSTRWINTGMQPGMMVSNEPGIYKEGQYGIRTENIILAEELCQNSDGVFLGFETLTFCPIAPEAIDYSLLLPDEQDFLSAYNKAVIQKLTPFLNEGEAAWLKCKCE
ncbi:MAG: aminopeptidase P family protein [Defluviitaleaceae bacterium]|nr:aminopeptidase P family protein [Defluviitaleaceae bacterium]